MFDLFLALLLLSLLVSVVMGVRYLIKRKTRTLKDKKQLQIILVVLAISFIGTFTTIDSYEPTEITTVTEETETKEEIKPVEDEDIDELEKKATEILDKKPNRSSVDNSGLEDYALGIMQENFNGMADITLNRNTKTFSMMPTGDVRVAVTSLATTHQDNYEVRNSWDMAVDSLTEMSKSISHTLPGYSIQMINPENAENALLWIYDGIVMYNFVDDF